MLRLADATIAAYQRMKTARGALDFDDLIIKTTALLARSDAAQWVQYKLDRGVEHILVDEAQDTSPRQWQVVKALVEEFFAGEGASSATRTLFAVGDQKQSIFSFQGAVPAWFTRMQRELGQRARAAEARWFDPQLHLSFRSVPSVLSAVDGVFAAPGAYRALSDTGEPPTHSAARLGVPGRVILWPMIAPAEKIEPEDWATPLDHLGEASPEVKLAKRLARTIGRWLHGGERLDSGEPIRAGGILILCRTRGAQTDAINRALKTAGVPIAGADRLHLTEHIAVMDLMALARVALLPEDDLSLAALLKSPLIGLGEDALFDLAHGRGGALWDALGRQAQERADFAEARARIERWRASADRREPYGFFARILGPEGGRERFLRRLGAEAEDVLDEFLTQALAYERIAAPTLQGFLAWLEGGTSEIKRDTETLRDEVRVMTVHGAKGLEADIVFVVDTGSMPVHPSHDAKVIALDDDRDGSVSPLVWMRRLKAMPKLVEARVKALRAGSQEEYLRLLYVAMTRARDRLIVCGTLKERGTDPVDGWHGLVTRCAGSGLRAPQGRRRRGRAGMAAAAARGPPDETAAARPAAGAASAGLAGARCAGAAAGARAPDAVDRFRRTGRRGSARGRRDFGGGGAGARAAHPPAAGIAAGDRGRGTGDHRRSLSRRLRHRPGRRRTRRPARRSDGGDGRSRLRPGVRRRQPRRGRDRRPGHAGQRRGGGLRPGRPAGGDRRTGADRRLQDQPARPGHAGQRARRLRQPARALPHDPPPALPRPRGGGGAAVDRPAGADGDPLGDARLAESAVVAG